MTRRRRHPEEHDSHERWLVSYADFITLLFAFFVVMYALSSLNEGKYKVLSESLVQAFRNNPMTARTPILLPNQTVQGAPQKLAPPQTALPKVDSPKLEEEVRKMQGMADDIRRSLGTLIDQGKVRVTQSKRGIAVEIGDSVLFQTGSADLQGNSIATLRGVAELVKHSENLIQVEGNTDNEPVTLPQFPSNWELSAARAASVVRLFVQAGVAPQRLVVIGYAEFRPQQSNDTEDGRSRNRRVTLNILADSKDEVAVLPSDPQSRLTQ